ncbi:hypothetical protein HYS00_05095 [Candidatus Microgenomates bacterium]|nr:hypothetical protein [Candidatus Microgenomates bacterium]
MQIVNVSNPASLSIVASVATGNSQKGVSVAVNNSGTRAYLVTGYSAGVKDFFVIDTSSKSGTLSPIGAGYSTGGMVPKGVALATGNRAIIVGTGGSSQYVVLSVDNELAPTTCATLAITNGAYDVATVLKSNGYAYSYIVTGDTNAELKMILGGDGGQHSSSGTFVSSAFDAGYATSFNRLSYTAAVPVNTTLQFQVAVANAVSGACTGASYTYLGPDGTTGTYFTTAGPVPVRTSGSYVNPGRCFKYKAYFTSSDPSQTPVLYDATVSYSP